MTPVHTGEDTATHRCFREEARLYRPAGPYRNPPARGDADHSQYGVVACRDGRRPKITIADECYGVVWFEWLLDGRTDDAMAFFEFADGLITRVTDFWPEPYEPPPGREHLVERWLPAALSSRRRTGDRAQYTAHHVQIHDGGNGELHHGHQQAPIGIGALSARKATGPVVTSGEDSVAVAGYQAEWIHGRFWRFSRAAGHRC